MLDVAYGDGRWVVVGFDGAILTSTDALTWVQQTVGVDILRGVAYGDGRWIVVGDNGAIFTSVNGLAWIPMEGGSNRWRGATYADGHWNIVGDYGAILTTITGLTFTHTDARPTYGSYNLVKSGGVYAAIQALARKTVQTVNGIPPVDGNVDVSGAGNVDDVMVDGESVVVERIANITGVARLDDNDELRFEQLNRESVFRIVKTPSPPEFMIQIVDSVAWFDVVVGDGRIVAVGNNGRIATATNAPNPDWAVQTVGTASRLGVGYHNGMFVATNAGITLTVSDDGGTTWANNAVTFSPAGMNFGNGSTLSHNGEGIWASAAGINIFTTNTPTGGWNSRFPGNPTATWNGALHSAQLTPVHRQLIAFGSQGLISSSNDGLNWTSFSAPISTMLRGGAYGNGRFVIVGDNGVVTTATPTTGAVPSNVQSQRVGEIGHRWNAAAYGGGMWVIVGTSGLVATSEDNGDTWTIQAVGTATWHGVTYGEGRFIIVGANGQIATTTSIVTFTHTDSVPTQNSQNLVKSAGVFAAIDALRTNLPAPTATTRGAIRLVDMGNGVFDIRTD